MKVKLSLFLQNKLHLYIRLPKKEVHKSSYDEKWKQVLAIHPQDDTCIPGAFVDWDNTPRKAERGDVYVGASPEKFKHYFDLQVKHVKKEYKTDWLVMFAWNEWAEGGILEPTERYGTAYLEAIRDVLIENGELSWHVLDMLVRFYDRLASCIVRRSEQCNPCIALWYLAGLEPEDSISS